MKRPLFIMPIAAFMAVAAPAFANEAKAPVEASIPFVNHGGIWSWTARGDQTIYFQDRFRRWYKAELMMPSYDLPFAIRIAVKTGPSNMLDNFSSVIINGQNYPIRSLVRIDGPPPPDHPSKAKATTKES